MVKENKGQAGELYSQIKRVEESVFDARNRKDAMGLAREFEEAFQVTF